jgi:hypothetical protein
MEIIEEKKLAINKINNISDLNLLKSINDLLDLLPIETEIFEKQKTLILQKFNNVVNKNTVLIDWETIQDEL